jgi:hypothetical protein
MTDVSSARGSRCSSDYGPQLTLQALRMSVHLVAGPHSVTAHYAKYVRRRCSLANGHSKTLCLTFIAT